VLAQGVVAQHGGHIHYISEVGRGTQVTVTLPPRPQAPPTGPVLTVAPATPSLPQIRAVEASA